MSINAIAGWRDRYGMGELTARRGASCLKALRLAALALATASAAAGAAVEPAAADAGPAPSERPVLKPLDVFDLQWAADPEVSPDGRSVAYVRMSKDIKTDRPRGASGSRASMVRAAPAEQRKTKHMPRWSPDGRRIAYLGAGATAHAALHVLGGQRRQRGHQPLHRGDRQPGLVAGRTLAGIHHAGAGGTQAAEGGTAGRAEGSQMGGSAEAHRSDGVPHRRRGILPNSFSQLFVVRRRRRGGAPANARRFRPRGPPAFSTDGKQRADHRQSAGRCRTTSRSTAKSTSGSDGRSLHASPIGAGRDSRAGGVPDGKHIAYLGFDDKRLGYQATQLYVMDADGAHPHSLTASRSIATPPPRSGRATAADLISNTPITARPSSRPSTSAGNAHAGG